MYLGRSRPMFLMEGQGTACPAPSSIQPSALSHLVHGLWGPEVAVPLLKVSLASAVASAREVPIQPVRFTPNGFRNQMCVVTVSCVCLLSYFNTKFTMCCEVHASKYCLGD